MFHGIPILTMKWPHHDPFTYLNHWVLHFAGCLFLGLFWGTAVLCSSQKTTSSIHRSFYMVCNCRNYLISYSSRGKFSVENNCITLVVHSFLLPSMYLNVCTDEEESAQTRGQNNKGATGALGPSTPLKIGLTCQDSLSMPDVSLGTLR